MRESAENAMEDQVQDLACLKLLPIIIDNQITQKFRLFRSILFYIQYSRCCSGMPNSQVSNRAFSLYALFSQYSLCNIRQNCFFPQFSPQSRAYTGMVFERTRSTF